MPPSSAVATCWASGGAGPAVLLLVVTTANCSSIRDEEAFGSQAGRLRVVRTEPPRGSSGVPIDSPIDVYFDQPLAAEALGRSAVQLLSGRVRILGGVKTDLLRRRLRFSPDGDLRSSLRYQLYISSELRGLDGALLDEPQTVGFTTGDGRQGPPGDGPDSVTATQLQSVWEARRCTGCHRGPNPTAGVDLSSGGAAVRTLRGVSSLGSQLLRVAPGDHASSYLLRKLLGGAAITGFAMPPAGPRLPHDELRQVADWIDGGAAE